MVVWNAVFCMQFSSFQLRNGMSLKRQGAYSLGLRSRRHSTSSLPLSVSSTGTSATPVIGNGCQRGLAISPGASLPKEYVE
jgi:hypothetical protein